MSGRKMMVNSGKTAYHLLAPSEGCNNTASLNYVYTKETLDYCHVIGWCQSKQWM